MKGSLIHALIIYFIGMMVVIHIRPKELCKANSTEFKSWKSINIEDTDSFYNIYVFAIALAYISYYISIKFVY